MTTIDSIYLQRPSDDVPWGFRLLGGLDYQQPLCVQRVTPGSVASQGLSSGDVITKIGDVDTSGLTHAQSMQTIKSSGNVLQLCVQKGAAMDLVAQCPPTPATPQSGAIRSSQPPLFNNSSGGYSQPSHNAPQSPGSGGYNYGTGEMSNGQGGYGGNYSNYNGQDNYGASPSARQPSQPYQQQEQPPAVPDAVLNMAAKGPADKKPFAYVADVNDIKEQREKVKKGTPVCTMPRYMQMLNMPQFDDRPRGGRGAVRSTPATPPPPSDTAVVANLQYNSPMGMYTDDNVVEALKGQTGSEVKDVVGLPKKEKQDVTQSPVYKMVHGLDQPKPKAAILYAEAHDSPLRRGGGREDGSEGEVGEYEQKSIRYTGRNIPSKSFRMLQNMTGGDQPEIVRSGPRTPDRGPADDDETRFSGLRHVPLPAHLQENPQYPQEEQRGGSEIDTTSIYQILHGEGAQPNTGEYDQKSVRYTGKSIPSRSFRMLQSMTEGGQPMPQASASPVRNRRPQNSDYGHRGGMKVNLRGGSQEPPEDSGPDRKSVV